MQGLLMVTLLLRPATRALTGGRFGVAGSVLTALLVLMRLALRFSLGIGLLLAYLGGGFISCHAGLLL